MATILIIDDEAWIANHLAARLEQDGHRVATFIGKSMVNAFRLIEKLHPNLVVLEYYRLQGYDGLELLYVLRNTAALAHLPIILVANKNPWYDVLPFLKSFQFQPDAYLLKPFSWDECAEIVNRLTSGGKTARPKYNAVQR